MALPKQGFGTGLGIGKETTWGTAVSRTAWFPLISESMKVSMPKRPRGTLAESSGSRNRRSHYIESKDVAGSVELLATYEGCGLWFEAMLGATPTTSGASTPYTHTYSLAGSLPSLTAELLRGDGYSEVYEGCKVSKGSFKVEAGKLMRFSADLIAEDSGGLIALGSASYTGARDLVADAADAGTISWNGLTLRYKSFELMVDNKLSPRRLCGSRLTAEPTPSDYQDITLKLELEWEDDALQAAFEADEQGDLTVAISQGSWSIEFQLSSAYLEDCSHPISGAGDISQSVTFRAEAASGNEGLKIVVQNTQSSATAA